MYVFEPRTFGAGTYCSANYATTIDLKCDHCERGGGGDTIVYVNSRNVTLCP